MIWIFQGQVAKCLHSLLVGSGTSCLELICNSSEKSEQFIKRPSVHPNSQPPAVSLPAECICLFASTDSVFHLNEKKISHPF